jgi:hypothetical protein
MITATQQAMAEVERDKAVLLKYAESRPVEAMDEPVLRRYESMGLVHFGFSFGKIESQANLTKRGKGLMGLAG